ncbi:MAG: LysM peptidoglycan-binding domain-containing protein [Chloroflexi bacterium]|nr:LysM peptidoglycan-binding domain-containing protein [Chloroflexota bacterium]
MRRLSAIWLIVFILSACNAPGATPLPAFPAEPTSTSMPTFAPTPTSLPTVERATRTPRPTATPIPPTPTPDPPRTNVPDLSALGPGWAAFRYTLQPGEDLGVIAGRYGVSFDQIRAANGFTGGEVLQPGQTILVPQVMQQTSPAFKIIPDSELVYGPTTIDFDTAAFVSKFKRGYLLNYRETVDGEPVSGAALIERAAQNYSLNPRLLLALLEYQSGWLTQAKPKNSVYPFGRAQGGTEGLYRQIQWAANALNRGFYEWRDGSLSLLILSDGTRVGLDGGLNGATVALQYFFSQTRSADDWGASVAVGGVAATFGRLFGGPFAHAVEPLAPAALAQPELTLPWQGGETWFYSGGPHASFGPGSPWGAVDFLPPGNASGCAVSENWITAMAPGVVARSGNGQVLLDLDGDGHEQTGWVVLYLHVATADRAPEGAHLVKGDHIGHPSCEGGFAKDAHAHVARKYNGAWLPADLAVAPFVMGDYTVHSSGLEYNGTLQFGQFFKVACACRDASNAVTK